MISMVSGLLLRGVKHGWILRWVLGWGRLKYGNVHVDTCVYVQDVSNRVAWHYQSLG